jgi:D-inositol-3-phosphate glycosyltransferase
MHHQPHAPFDVGSRLERVALLSVHTCPLDQPGTGDAGGMNVYLREVAIRLAEMGVQVDVFTRDPGCPQPIAQMAPGARAIHLEAGPRSVIAKDAVASLLEPFTYALTTFAEAEGHGYDLVHGHYWMSGKVGRLLSERWQVPFLQTFHTLAKVKNLNLGPNDRPEPAERIAAEERIIANADQILTPTMAEAAELRDLYGAEASRVRVISPGVDPDRFRPSSHPTEIKERLGLPTDRPIVLFVGRLQPLKAPEMAVRAVAGLPEGGYARPLLLIVGGPSGILGSDPDDLRTLALSCGMTVDDIRFLPPQPHDQLADLYRVASVTVVPSRTESFGLVALESAACGTPVVASDVGGLRTTVRDGETGLLVAPGDAEGFSTAIHSILVDEDHRMELSQRGVGFARRFDWRWVARGLLSAYEDAVTAGNRKSAREAHGMGEAG